MGHGFSYALNCLSMIVLYTDYHIIPQNKSHYTGWLVSAFTVASYSGGGGCYLVRDTWLDREVCRLEFGWRL